jgi:leucyl-tRNA synthetase
LGTADHAFVSRERSERDHEVTGLAHRTVRKVTEDIEGFRFNTAVPALMILANELGDYVGEDAHRETFDDAFDLLLLLMAPMAPHVSHELWERRGHETMLALEDWPTWDEQLAREETVTMVVQINGKVRDRIEVSADISAEEAEELALRSDKIQGWIDGQKVDRVIARPPNLVNVVAG